MMSFDYKKYSLENLENWVHDAMSAGEATPQEIYDTIKGVVKENYYTYKHQTSQAYELLALLNGNGKGHITEEYGLQYTDEEITAMCDAAELQDLKKRCELLDAENQMLTNLKKNLEDELELRKKWNL